MTKFSSYFVGGEGYKQDQEQFGQAYLEANWILWPTKNENRPITQVTKYSLLKPHFQKNIGSTKWA